jgi:hypothetical protein
MNEKLEYLLKTKAYSELTEVELREFTGLCDSREEYENMQLFFSQLDNYKTTQKHETHYMTKGSLDEIFEKKYKKSSILVKFFPPNKPIYLSPLVQLAALIVVVFLIFQFTSSDTNTTPQIAQVENPTVKPKPKVEKEKTVNKDQPKNEQKPQKNLNTNSLKPKNNESQNKDIPTAFEFTKDETIAVSSTEYNSGVSTDYSTTINANSTSPTNYFSATTTHLSSTPSATTGKATMQSRTAYREEEDLQDVKTTKDKKSNSTVQPKLFDLLTAVY